MNQESRIKKKTKKEFGVAALLVTLLALFASTSLLLVFSFLVINEKNVTRSLSDSVKSYYAAESGLEDVLLRLQPGHNALPASYNISVGDGQATVVVGSLIGGARNIIADGNVNNRHRRVSLTASEETVSVPFFYGAQVGDAGLTLGSGSKILGNVFSNGNIVGSSANSSEITGTAKVAGAHKIDTAKIDIDAYANNFNNCNIGNIAYYVSSITSCPAGSTKQISSNIDPLPFPISQSQINSWETGAANGGSLSSLDIGNNDTMTLGPKKIAGNATFGNNSTLIMTGTIWITGTLSFGNSVTIRLDPSSYGAESGIFINDSSMTIGNNAVLEGSNQAGSFLLVINNALSTAITINNNASGSILYAPNGTISVGNNLGLREAVGYGLNVGNNSTITYETGLLDASFSSGPAGGFVAKNWQEIP